VDWYPWVVFIHAATVLLFFIAHGTSMAVAFAVRREENLDRLRASLDLSQRAMGPATIVLSLVGIVAGIVAGFMGDWWGKLWIWISLVLLLVVAGGMTPLAAVRLNAMRVAAGLPNPRQRDAAPAENLEELRRLQAAWNPTPIAVVGIASFVVILFLMMVKPF
jgi:Predicted integral membrane protein (DUF2269)